jgi:hypothetical protein
MSSNLSIIPPSSEGPGSEGHSPSGRRPGRQAAPAPEPEAPPADPGQRLIIEEVEGGLVYTVIDRASGAVVGRASRDEVAQMGQQPDYAAGTLIRAKA